MTRLLTALLFLALIIPSFSYDRRAAEEELRFLSQNARAYLTEVLIWAVVVAIVVFAIVLCICDIAIRMCFDHCSREAQTKEKAPIQTPTFYVDAEADSTSTSTTSASGADYYVNACSPSQSVIV